jgi:hypothetical protein
VYARCAAAAAAAAAVAVAVAAEQSAANTIARAHLHAIWQVSLSVVFSEQCVHGKTALQG